MPEPGARRSRAGIDTSLQENLPALGHVFRVLSLGFELLVSSHRVV